MNNCSKCGQALPESEARCPHCKSLNSKIDNILAREAAAAEKLTLKGKIRTITHSTNKKQALLSEITTLKQGLTPKSIFTLFVIFVFIFAMSYIVI